MLNPPDAAGPPTRPSLCWSALASHRPAELECSSAQQPARYPDTWGDATGGKGWVDIGKVLAHRDALTVRMSQVADEPEEMVNSWD